MLHGTGEEGRRTCRYSKSTQQDVELTAQQGRGQQVCQQQEEKFEEEEEEIGGGEEEEKKEGGDRVDQARTTHLNDVVARLQGDIQAGATPQVRSRVKLDGLFAELRVVEPPAPTFTLSLIHI